MPYSASSNAILVIGGIEDKVYERDILHAFVTRSGGKNAKIGIVPTASPDPILTGERYQSIFKALGARSSGIFDIRDRAHAENHSYLDFIDDCTGVFFTEGETWRLCELLADTPLLEQLRQRVQAREITLGGNGAGAAVMGHNIIIGGESGIYPHRALVDLSIGFGIIPEVIIDQHFNNLNRMARLISAIAIQPNRIGIGIDQDTCAIFTGDNQLEIIGQGNVTILDPQYISFNNQTQVDPSHPLTLQDLRIHILSHGDHYQLHEPKLF